MEYSNCVIPYVLQWYNEVFLIEFNEKRSKNNNDDNDEVGLTTRQLVDATFRIKEHRFSTQQINETYIDPLVNAGYIDKIENKQDKRSYIPPSGIKCKTKKLFDLNKTNNFLHNKPLTCRRRSNVIEKNYPTTCYSLTMTRIRRKGDRTLARHYSTKAARIRIKK
jgi:hypothetical protein